MTLTIKWLAQSCFQIRTADKCIYTDPGHVDGADKLPKADLVLVTHHHYDHLQKRVMAALTGDDTLAVGPERTRRKLGPRKLIIKPGASVDVKGVPLTAVHAYNPPGSRGLITYHRKGVGVGYIFTLDGKRIYHAGDTGLIDEMREFGPVDIALLPIGGKFTLDIPEAAEAVQRIKPKVVIPMHMFKADPLAFKEQVEKSSSVNVLVLRPGEETTYE